MTLVEQHRDEVLRLYVPGVFGISRVARELGISHSTVRRIIDPEKAERDRQQSNAAKRRRVGVCEDCGGPTRYNGHTVNGPSAVCHDCQDQRQRDAKIWTREAIVAAMQTWAKKYGRTPTTRDWWHAGDDHPNCHAIYGYSVKPNGHRVDRAFPTWAAAVEAAGLPYPYPNRLGGGPGKKRFDREEARRLRETLSDAKIAERFGVTATAIYQALGPRYKQLGGTPCAATPSSGS